ncbi:MAG: copper homeostasis protein CutC [Planctomycetes bacterium]|nr:copper homeostasis protein CutC [Planctomycetota bacterium]
MSRAARKLEIVATSLADAAAAARGGADRLELCVDLACGGVTPPQTLLAQIRDAHPALDLRVLLRPHGGPFTLSRDELRALLAEVRRARELGLQGIVIGALGADGAIDRESMRRLREEARPLEATFHRAFDLLARQEEALESLIELGFERVLTSGDESTAWDGRVRLRALIRQAAERLLVLPGGGVRSAHAAALLAATGARELHSSARTGGELVDEAEVRALRAALERS